MRFMSSPRSAPAKPSPRSRKAAAAGAGKRTASNDIRKPADLGDGNGAVGSMQAKRLAAEIEQALARGERDVLSAEALQVLMAAVCKTYAAQVEAGEPLLPLPQRGGATATEVMITASGLLKAANLAVFELGMWQSWTGR